MRQISTFKIASGEHRCIGEIFVPLGATAVVEAVKYVGSTAGGKSSFYCRSQLLLCVRGDGDGIVSPTV